MLARQDIPAAAAQLLRDRGFTNRNIRHNGSYSAHGAIEFVAEAPGDAEIVRQFASMEGITRSWECDPERSPEEAIAALESLDVSDTALHEQLGERWGNIIEMVHSCATLTLWQADTIKESYFNTDDNERAVMWGRLSIAKDIAYGSRPQSSYHVRPGSAMGVIAMGRSLARLGQFPGRDLTPHPAVFVAERAIEAVACRDLVGVGDYTIESYEVLVSDWLSAALVLEPQKFLIS